MDDQGQKYPLPKHGHDWWTAGKPGGKQHIVVRGHDGAYRALCGASDAGLLAEHRQASCIPCGKAAKRIHGRLAVLIRGWITQTGIGGVS